MRAALIRRPARAVGHLVGAGLVLVAGPLMAEPQPVLSPRAVDRCVTRLAASAADDVTVGTLRQACVDQLVQQPAGAETPGAADAAGSALARRVRAEEVTQLNPFVLTPHRPNYVLPISYQDSPNLASTNGNGLAERTEVQFQVSFKFPVLQDVLGSGGDVYLAYTGVSFWQAYDVDQSRPFRETNHEPEAFIEFAGGWRLLGTRLSLIRVGINHQSNGQDLPDSRSWNRVFATFLWEMDDLVFGLRPWVRIPDPPKDGPDDPRGDDNPDIERFAGQFEALVAWSNDNDTYSALWRNNARADNRGSLTLGWSFPLAGRARGYVRAFTGYAESLIDYDDHHNRISIGILLTDWL